jgi:hypothetical protein
MSDGRNAAKVKVAGLWRNKARDGSAYLSGNWGDARVLIFPNGYKQGDKEPDYLMYIAPRQQQAKPITGNGAPVVNEHHGAPL